MSGSARKPRPPRSGHRPPRPSLLGLALTLAGLLALAKAMLLIEGFAAAGPNLETAVPAPEGAQGESAPEPLPEPAAGPNRDESSAPPDESRPALGQDHISSDSEQSAPPAVDPAVLDATEREILEEFAARRAALDERARQIELRAAVLETAEARLAEQLERLSKLHAALTAVIEKHDAAEEEKLASLVKIYETMKPKAAAEIFDRLDMGVLLRVVSQMSETKSSAVIARMQPPKAEQLTAALARRSELPRIEP